MAQIGATQKIREDDVLECYLYPKFCFTSNADVVTESLLVEEIAKFNKEIEAYVKDYMWHKDPLVFRPKTKQAVMLEKVIDGAPSEDCQVIPHIHVTLRFDEDIGDEWFTVFLIFKLTKTFKGLIARMVDSDGEFLLIEAADALPAWANPENCEDRVFIYNGSVHVVQDKHKSMMNMLNGICEKPHFSKMSEKVQSILKQRLSVYPEEIQKRKHKARAFLPERAASILQVRPELVASAIRTICHSDPLERKVCRGMRYFPPEQRVMANVRMTKCLYAMITHCRYTGDPRTGWNLPPANSSKYKAHVLGVKIACGLEILVARANEERRVSAKRVQEDTDGKESFQKALDTYLNRLEAIGYFREALEGSKKREELVRIAKEYFLQNSQLPDTSLLAQNENEPEKVLEAWKNVQTNDIEMQATDEATLSPADSDSWLNVDPAQLEMMLNQQWGNTGAKEGEKKFDQEPVSLREKVQAFFNQTSGLDGVQFLREQQSMEDDDMKPDTEDNGRIEFDSDVFDSTLRDILDLVVPGTDGEFDGSSEGSLGGDDEDRGGEMGKYMRLLDSQLEKEMVKDPKDDKMSVDTVESNLTGSMEAEAGGSGPAGNIIGGPIRRLMHLQLQSPTTVPPDLQS